LEHDELPLKVGDTVTYNNHVAAFGITGIVVERVGQDLIRVKWGDLSLPTTHRSHSLKRAPRGVSFRKAAANARS